MKRILSIIAITAISFSTTAQEKREIKQHKDGAQQGMHKKGKHHNRQMMKDMNFSEAQQSQMKANREEYKTKLQQLKQDKNITLKDFNEKKETLNKEQKAKMQSLLTPEQKAIMAANKAKHEQEKTERQNKHFEKMKVDLSLTDDQANKLKAQNELTRNNMKAIRENESLSKEERMKQMKALKENSQQQRKSILTADQLKKMEEMKKDKHKEAKK